MIPRVRLYFDLHASQQSNHFSEDLYVVFGIEYEIAHRRVFRMENDLPVLAEKSFYGCAFFDPVLKHGDDDIAVFCIGLLAYNNLISVKDSRFDHTVAADGEHEQIFAFEFRRRQGIIAFVTFGCKNRLTCGNRTDERHGNAGCVFDRYGAFFIVGFVQQAFCFQPIDIVVYGCRRFDTEFAANIAHGRRETVFVVITVNELKNLIEYAATNLDYINI